MFTPRQLAKEVIAGTKIGQMQIEAYRGLLNARPDIAPEELLRRIAPTLPPTEINEQG